MNKTRTVQSVIHDLGIARFKTMLEDHTGKTFTLQQINNWRHRGVPYRWHDTVNEVHHIEKSNLRLGAM